MPHADPEIRREYMRSWRQKNAGKMREYNRAYAIENKETIRKNHKDWEAKTPHLVRASYEKEYARHREKILAKNRAYNNSHKERRREVAREYKKTSPVHKAWVEKTRDERNAKNRERRRRLPTWKNYLEANREKINELNRKWRESPKGRAYFERTRASRAAYMLARYHLYRDFYREYQAEFNVKSPRRISIYRKWEACGQLCYICGEHLPFEDIEVEHVIPKAKGGTNDISNLMPAHRRCNCLKLDKLDYPIRRPDLIEACSHIQSVPRKIRLKKAA